MLLSITCKGQHATALGYLLHKHPEKLQAFPLSFGMVHVFYPQVDADTCTACMLLDIDPIQLFRSRRTTGASGFTLQQYVNDRPYAASSYLSVAIAQVYRSALGGQCKEKPDFVTLAMPLTAKIDVIVSNAGEAMIYRLFEPLGYQVTTNQHPVDDAFPDWGMGSVFSVELCAETCLKDLLSHLYLLLPVLDDDKHYYVNDEEVNKLLAYGEGWLANHPQQEMIVKRYLRHNRSLTESALTQLREDDGGMIAIESDQRQDKEETIEKSSGLNQQRLEAVLAALKQSQAARVIDLGCGEGRLLRLLLPDEQFTQVSGMDVSIRNLENAAWHLQIEKLPEYQQKKLKLFQGSLLYRDHRLVGYDAAALIEVIEHLDPARLSIMESVVFGNAKPATIIITTPNRAYNQLWLNLPVGQMRHPDHHFEWTRAEFESWAKKTASRHDYTVIFSGIGQAHEEYGAPTQMAVFQRKASQP